MIVVTNSEYNELRVSGNFVPSRCTGETGYWWDNFIGYYFDEMVWLCPHCKNNREHSICETCEYKFKCFTTNWVKTN